MANSLPGDPAPDAADSGAARTRPTPLDVAPNAPMANAAEPARAMAHAAEPARTPTDGPEQPAMSTDATTVTSETMCGDDVSIETGRSRTVGVQYTEPRRRPSPVDVISHRGTPRPAPPSTPRQRMPRTDEYSAGGLVVSRRGPAPAAAIIGRTDRRGRLLWSLPKGHIEAGETAVEAAIREVEEETGIIGTVIAPLGKIDYWFVAEGRRVHKTVTHFLMNAIGGELSDEDAEVVAVEWVPLDNLSRRLAYADERRIASDAIRILADIA